MRNPRHEAKITPDGKVSRSTGRSDGLPKGAPRRPGFKSVLIRGGIAAAVFFLFLYYVNKDSLGVALAYTLVILVLMIPLGMLLDRVSHRMAMRRWRRQQGGA